MSLQPHVSVASECEDIDGIMAPVMHIIPELHELSGETSPPLSMVHPQVELLGTLAVWGQGSVA
jgi:hypothetical protein